MVIGFSITGFYGQINARGGIESGDGGLVEVSSKEHLIFRGKVDTSAVNGFSGTLLLDPTNIIIADGSGDEAGDGTDSFAGNNSGVVGSILTTPLNEIDGTAPTTIYESELEGLSGDTNIILQATNDITLQNLTDNGLDLAAGEGVIAFSADADGDGVGDFVMEDNVADTIFSNGRDVVISGTNLTLGNIGTFQQGGNTGDAGDITLIADESISATNGVFIGSATFGAGNAGDINIQAETLSVTNGAFVDASTFGQGNGGAIAINVTESITLSGKDSNGFGSGIFSQVSSSGQGMAGSITIDTGSLSLTDGAQVDASIFGQGNVGAIEVEDSGAIAINATGEIFLSGQDSQGNPSGIFSQVEAGAEGTAVGISIDTESLSLTNGAVVSTKTEGEGKAGDIAITANTLEATSGSQIKTNTTTDFEAADITLEISNNLFLSGIDSGLFAQTEGTGKAGNIIINSPQLTIDRGASISAFTQGSGDGGTITVNAAQAVLLTDNSELTVETSGAGKPGDITITTPNLTIGECH